MSGGEGAGPGQRSAGPLAVAAAGGGRLFDLDTLAEIELPKEDVPDRFGRPDAAARLPLTGPNVWAAANGRMFVCAGSSAWRAAGSR